MIDFMLVRKWKREGNVERKKFVEDDERKKLNQRSTLVWTLSGSQKSETVKGSVKLLVHRHILFVGGSI